MASFTRIPLRTVIGTILTILLIPVSTFSHCDTMNGPVVKDAQIALEQRDITPVLKWLKPQHEAEAQKVFAQTLTVRNLGTEARALADRHFFETIVRLHRAGEGAPYTGLKDSVEADPVISAADSAIASGSIKKLNALLSKHIGDGLEARFSKVVEKIKARNRSVQDGRKYVEAYVDFIHYAERLGLADQSDETVQHENVHGD